MASWRAPGSILEAPGLDFGASGLDFPRFWTSKTMPEGFPGWRTLCHQLVLHHWAVRGRKVAEILPSHGTSASNACASVSWRRWARCSRSGVAGGVPPLGAFNGILPKRLRNRCSNKHAIFHRFLLQRASVAKAPTSILYWFLQYKMALGRFSSCCFLHGFGIQKTIQKPIKNHARATQKSISKTCCFLISIFSHFGFDFGGSWASNLEPSWLKMPPPSVK